MAFSRDRIRLMLALGIAISVGLADARWRRFAQEGVTGETTPAVLKDPPPKDAPPAAGDGSTQQRQGLLSPFEEDFLKGLYGGGGAGGKGPVVPGLLPGKPQVPLGGQTPYNVPGLLPGKPPIPPAGGHSPYNEPCHVPPPDLQTQVDPYPGAGDGGGIGGIPPPGLPGIGDGGVKIPPGLPGPGIGGGKPVVPVAPYPPAVPEPGPDHAGCHYPYDCVPFYLCQNGEIVTDGAGILDVRSLNGESVNMGGNCPHALDACCKEPPENITPPPKMPYQPKCGQRHDKGFTDANLDFRIVFGNQTYLAETQFGEFPWMAAVLKTLISPPDAKGYREEKDLYQCGGSLIHPKVVLTAAHCVESFKVDPQPLKVRLGEWDTQTDKEPYRDEDRRVTKVVVHDKYVKATLINDIALLFLDSPVELYHHIDTVCLPDYGANFEGKYCTVTGWGKNKFDVGGSYQEILKRIDVPIVTNYECQHALRSTTLGKRFKLHPSFVCAGGEPGKDACQGDGGSPLVCYDDYRQSYVQVGIVSWGIRCGEGGVPGVYADVVQHVDWIDAVVNEYFPSEAPYWTLRKSEERAGDGLKKEGVKKGETPPLQDKVMASLVTKN